MKTQVATDNLIQSFWTAAVVIAGLVTSSGQSLLKTVKYFGFAEFSVTTPIGGLVEGTNGALYGMTAFGGEDGNGVVFKINPDGTGLLVLRSFKGGEDARLPAGTMALGSNGKLYGATWSGGTSNLGAIFTLNQDGTGYSVIKSFTGGNGDGASPYAGPFQAQNGLLYGTTYSGGSSNLGTIFRVNPDGTGFSVLWSFAGGAADGARPTAGLIQGADGALYGTTQQGGTQNQGTIFGFNPDGTGFRVVKSFAGGTTDGAQPRSSLVQTAEGTLFGTTYSGGAASKGTLYRILPDGGGFQLLRSFGGSDGASPLAPVTIGSNGILYGTTSAGGSSTNGVIFQINQDGTGFGVLKSYSGTGSDGVQANGPLLQAADGRIYGTTQRGGTFDDGTAFAIGVSDASYTILNNFTETGGDGTNPYGDLIEGRDGAIYGTTQNGGSSGQGTVYKLNKDGSGAVVLKSFSGTAADGCSPSAGLVQGPDGTLYGTAMYDLRYQSGSSTLVSGYGHVFRLNPNGSGYEMLKKFGGTPDGANPYGSLLMAKDGFLYGTTMNGGSKGLGTVFKLNTNGSDYVVIKSFQDTGTTDGARPYAGVIQASDGVLYGTTSVGGTGSQGTVFRMNPDGSGYAVLRRFTGGDGASPWAPLLQAIDGAFYGTTAMGGANGKGVVFKLNPDGTGFAVLKVFTGADGSSPMAGLIQAPNGILYGTTSSGGAANFMDSVGTVYQLNPDGTGFHVLKTFPQSGEGFMPKSAVFLGSDGTLYGATYNGGRGGNSYGTIFSLLPAPILNTLARDTTGYRLSVFALPGRAYTIQRASSPKGGWNAIGTATVGAAGIGELLDPSPPSSSVFYRAVYP